ncbi:hypothetical protein VNO77_14187 [Canavalia gladiata]|uniref:Uncharacterized protein n=1 Tax=Canavalia gladiata TaxID=3824 RepID=A0AAN9QRX3_CANGL
MLAACKDSLTPSMPAAFFLTPVSHKNHLPQGMSEEKYFPQAVLPGSSLDGQVIPWLGVMMTISRNVIPFRALVDPTGVHVKGMLTFVLCPHNLWARVDPRLHS